MRRRQRLLTAVFAASLAGCFDGSPSKTDDGELVDKQYHPTPSKLGELLQALKQPSRGAPIAVAPNGAIAVVVNRDVGSATVLAVRQKKGHPPRTTVIAEIDLGAGSEPWQAVVAPDSETAFVVLRKAQKLVRIRHLSRKPYVDGYVRVGSEPTSLALSPTGLTAFVANWGNGDISVVNTLRLKVTRTIDLNEALANTGYLGDVNPRPALAHPRSITVSNDGDFRDSDEYLLVTEYFSQQFEELQPDGLNADVNRVGIVYKVELADYSVSTINLAPLENIGFRDSAGNPAGCFPNQLQSITLNGDLAYVVSVCAAPEGPEGLRATMTQCQSVADCTGLNLVDPVCDVIAFGTPRVCQDVASFKTATSPVVSVIDAEQGVEVAGAARNLNASFDAFFRAQGIASAGQRFPLFAMDLAFVPGTGEGYLAANGIDAVFRVVYDEDTGELIEVGSPLAPFINLNPAGIQAGKGGKGPIGVAITGNRREKFALVANDITRNVTAVDLGTQSIAGGLGSPSVTATAALPAPGSDEASILIGRELFNTGRARWSLFGQGWGACQSCHADGLTDNVTWYFGRGPRQSVSLDTSFASNDPLDQRLLNHTTNRDEMADFELNVRNTSGGVGAIVLALSAPPQNIDRIDTVRLGLAELLGSSEKAADPANPFGLGIDANGQVTVGELFVNPNAEPAGSLLEDWINITRYIQTIRSPRRPTNLDPAQVAAGAALFAQQGTCQGCHGGDKWTVSRLFYDPNIATNAALRVTQFVVPPGFPAAILPATAPENQLLIINAGGDSVQCVERNVQTFRLAEPGVGIAEVRGTNMTDLAQGGGALVNGSLAGIGYNVPALIGVAAGPPFMHAGNARTLEALFEPLFAAHHQALSAGFLGDPATAEEQKQALIQYLLSIDEDTSAIPLPPPGPQGGALCPDFFAPPPVP